MSFQASICKTVDRTNSFNRGKLDTVAKRMLGMKKQLPINLELALENYINQTGYTKEGYTEDLARECLYILEVETYWKLSEEERDKLDTEYMKKH